MCRVLPTIRPIPPRVTPPGVTRFTGNQALAAGSPRLVAGILLT
ncbi:MAG: hypothetical protein ACKO9Z_12915 [Planctomycetota bacterium]